MARNDSQTLNVENPGVMDDGAGNDTYILSNNLVQAGAEITILDAEGSNKIQLIDGLEIASSEVAADAVKLTLTNGAEITILQASNFTFEIGGNPFLGEAGTIQTFADFTTATLDPAGGAVTIGSTTTPIGDPTFDLAADATGVNEGDTANFTLTSENVADGTEVAYTVSGVDAADLASGSLTGTAIVNGNTATIAIDVAADELTEGEETMTVSIDGQTTTASMTVNDTSTDGTYTLTEGVDVATANVFNASRVTNVDDDTNSLDDDDVLTGEGDNPTLNFTYTNDDTRNADYDIAPTLNGIETINVKSTTDFANILDLQDGSASLNTLNITRVDANTGVDNLTKAQANLSVSNSAQLNNSVGFFYTNSALSGTSDTTTLTLSNVNVNNLFVEESTAGTIGTSSGSDGTLDQGYETINLVTTGSASRVDGTFNAEDLQTLNISGDQNLRIDNIAEGGSLATVDASTFTGNLDIAFANNVIDATPDGQSNGDITFSATTFTGDDTIRVVDQIGKEDTIAMGDGDDTLKVQATDATENYTEAGTTITGVNKVELLNSDADAAVIAFKADEATDDQSFLLRNNTDGAGNQTTYNVMNLSATEATQIEIQHSGNTGNAPAASSNALADNIVNLDVADGVTTATVTIGEGVNADDRFNFQLYTDSDISVSDSTGALSATNVDNGTNTVTSLTLVDSDSEDNTVELLAQSENGAGVDRGQATAYTSKITVTGGTEGKFLNLDATANLHGYDIDGSGGTDVAFGGETGAQDVGAGAAERIIAATFDASAHVGNVTARFSSNPNDTNGAQTITMGTGADTVIFDNLTSTNAGLTIADTVAGGAGSDTLAIDGNGAAVSLGASEWTNVSGFETIKTIGNGNSYNLTLTDNLIDNNAADGNIINIVNDNDQDNDSNNDNSAAIGGAESAVTIDARGLSATNNFTYDGEEGASRTDDTFIFADVNINSKAVIDGGAVDNNTSNHDSGAVGNNDVLQVNNAAQVDFGDLANIKNVGTIAFTNDTAVNQSSRLQLNDTIVDAMVDSYQSSVSRGSTSLAPNAEALKVTVTDSAAINSVTSATTGLTLEAGGLSDKSDVDVILGRGNNNIVTGNGNDVAVLLGNYNAGTYGTAESTSITAAGAVARNVVVNVNDFNTGSVANRVVTDTINLDDGTDTLITYGNLNLVGATLTGIENLVINSNVVLTESQFNSITNITADGTAGGNHTLTIVDDSAGTTQVDVSKVKADNGAALNVVTGGNTNVTAAAGGTNDTQTTGTTNTNVTLNGGATSNPNFTIADIAVAEDVGNATLTITRDNATDAATINVSTADATATAGADYTAKANESVSFAAGATTATVDIAIINDTATEGAETFNVNLSNASIGTITDNQAVVTINANDAATGTATTVNVNATGVDDSGNDSAQDASAADTTFNIVGATSDFTYNIAGFAAGDKIDFADGYAAPTVTNTNFTDGSVTVSAVNGTSVATLELTGIAETGNFIVDANTFNAVFGAGSLA